MSISAGIRHLQRGQVLLSMIHLLQSLNHEEGSMEPQLWACGPRLQAQLL